MDDATTLSLIDQAKGGQRAALESLLGQVQRPIYNLALRMLGNPAEAQDSTQDVLLKIATRLSTFRGESAFSTWVYRVAANHLLNQKQEAQNLGFDQMAEMIDQGLNPAYARPPTPQDSILAEEAKLTCTHGMLLCLDRDHRLAYILGEVFEYNGEEAAAILEIEPAAFRKRLSRARDRMESFMQGRCGLVNRDAPCRCSKQVPGMIQREIIDPANIKLANHPAAQQLRQLGALASSAAVFRSHPDYQAPDLFQSKIRDLLVASTPS